MKRLLAYLFDLVRAVTRRTEPVHNDALRANQFNEPRPTFGYWRSLVG